MITFVIERIRNFIHKNHRINYNIKENVMLELKNIYKGFDQRVVLDHISLQFPDTGFIGIQGESGCGKSTLLSIIGMLDDHYLGDIYYNHEKITDRNAFIREHISFMMQNKDVINALTV